MHRSAKHVPIAAAVLLVAGLARPVSAQGPLEQPFPPVSSVAGDGITGFRVNLLRDSTSAVARAGDLNNDGIDDFIIGAAWPDSSSRYTGAAYVVFGRADGFPGFIDLIYLDGTTGFRLERDPMGDRVGSSVAPAGDVNGDGIDDVVIGASKLASRSQDSGAYVVFGRNGGFPAVVDLGDLGGTAGFRLEDIPSSSRQSNEAGRSVASADVNGDGLNDIIVGAPKASIGTRLEAGITYVVFGRNGGFPAVLNAGDLDGAFGYRINGVASDDLSGTSIAGADDVNGDGIDDIIIGAKDARAGRGEAYVVFGRRGTHPAEVELSDLDGTDGFRLTTGSHSVALTEVGVAVASTDVNGDGLDDVVVGAPGAGPIGSYYGQYNAGQTFVVFGRDYGFPATVTLNELHGSTGFRIDGDQPIDDSGRSVGPAGDINGDGLDDLIIGAEHRGSVHIGYGYYDRGEGAAYVVFGRKGGFPAVVELSQVDGESSIRIDGTGCCLARSVSGAGDVNADGSDDVVISNYGRSFVVYGRLAACRADLDGDGELTLFDFLVFQNLFDAGDPLADFDDDGELTIFDFLAFQNAFAAGCS
ncbi:MAG: GC-type dockerin domain-anchored protein [Planctomycetota bacterium]